MLVIINYYFGLGSQYVGQLATQGGHVTGRIRIYSTLHGGFDCSIRARGVLVV